MMFQDKVVIVTGASSGIGADTAVAFAKQGAKLVLGGRNEENLKKTAETCKQHGSKSEDVLLVVGDLFNEEICNRTVDEAVEQFGRLDVLVNNAGSLVTGNIDKATIEDMDAMLSIHVRSAFMLSKRAVPHLKKTKGSIVNVSAALSKVPAGGILLYCTAKSALNCFSQCLAQDVGPSGVRVNCILPGIIDTPIFSRPGGFIEGHPEKQSELFAGLAQHHTLGHCGKTEDCSRLILFLASEDAAFITGALVPVDAGLSGKNPF